MSVKPNELDSSENDPQYCIITSIRYDIKNSFIFLIRIKRHVTDSNI